MFRKIFSNRITRNAIWLIGGKVAQMIINLLVGLLVARYLGPSNYGLINYATAYTAFFMAFCTLGINSVIVKEFIDHPGQEGKIIGTTLGLRAISSLLSATTIILIVCIADHGDSTTIIVTALCSIGMFFHIADTVNYWFQSRLQSRVTAIITLCAYAITAIYKLILVITGKNVAFFAFSTAIDYICIGIFQIVAYKKYGGGRLSFSREYGRKLLRKSCHFILPSLMIAIYGQTDRIMLKQMVDEAEVGFYSTAVAISGVWCFVLTAIIDSLQPAIMEAHRDNEQLFNKRNRQLYAIVFYLSIFVAVIISLFANLIIYIMYGEKYANSVEPLRIVTWYTAFSYLGVARNAWIVCRNCQKFLLYVYLAAAVANVGLNWILIPVLGATGAAIASFVAQFFTTMVVPLFIKELRANTKLMIDAILLKDVK